MGEGVHVRVGERVGDGVVVAVDDGVGEKVGVNVVVGVQVDVDVIVTTPKESLKASACDWLPARKMRIKEPTNTNPIITSINP